MAPMAWNSAREVRSGTMEQQRVQALNKATPTTAPKESNRKRESESGSQCQKQFQRNSGNGRKANICGILKSPIKSVFKNRAKAGKRKRESVTETVSANSEKQP